MRRKSEVHPLSVLRRDPVSGSWVIVTEERAARPNDFSSNGDRPRVCPFCEGNERETPHEIRVHRPRGESDGPGWTWRVVPNSFAALRIEGEPQAIFDGLHDRMNGIGAHEVVIETPRHDARLPEYSVEKIASLLEVYRERVEDLHRDPRFPYVQVFRNYLPDAGASLRHPHSQVIALPMVPRRVLEEMHNAREYRLAHGRCIFCELADTELREGLRLVDANEHFVAYCPYAATLPFETWIQPRRHAAQFAAIPQECMPELALLLKRVLWALQEAAGDPPYNLVVHGAPADFRCSDPRSGDTKPEAFHWHIEILPRITRFAGFEMGTGFHINPMPPENAAAAMRRVLEGNPLIPDLVTT